MAAKGDDGIYPNTSTRKHHQFSSTGQSSRIPFRSSTGRSSGFGILLEKNDRTADHQGGNGDATYSDFRLKLY
jgi:hypothetical protein